jgi:hypothetical protein
MPIRDPDSTPIDSETGQKVEGRKSHAEERPATVALAKRLHRLNPKTGQRQSLREIATALVPHDDAQGSEVARRSPADMPLPGLGEAVQTLQLRSSGKGRPPIRATSRTGTRAKLSRYLL